MKRLSSGKTGGRRGRLRRFIGTLTATALILVGGVVGGAPANASIVVDPCEYGVFISVRGLTAPAGSNPIHGGRVWSSGGEGLISGLANKLRYNSPLPLAFYSLNYTASAWGPDYYTSSIDGRNALVTEINWLAEQCGFTLPAIILAGHSQGGAIVQSTLITYPAPNVNLTAKGRASIMAVASFGDPHFRPGQAYNAPASASGQGILGPWLQFEADQIASHRVWGWPMGGSGQGWVQKVRAWCFSTDFFCASGSDQAIHSAYDLNFDAAHDWIEYVVNAF